MKRLAFLVVVVVMTGVFSFMQPKSTAAMANCAKSVVASGWLTAGGSQPMTITTVNAYAGETLALTLNNSNPSQQVWFQIGSQSLTQVGSGTLSVSFNQATSNVVVKGGGSAIYKPNTYYMIWYELDAYSLCRPVNHR